MDKKKILKKEIKKNSKYTGIVGPYDPYALSQVPGAYIHGVRPTVPGSKSN